MLYSLPLNQSNYIKASPYQLLLFTEHKVQRGNICSDIQTERSEEGVLLSVRTSFSHMNRAKFDLIQFLLYTHANKLISLIKNIMLTSFKRFPVYASAGLYVSKPIKLRNSLHI